MFKECETNSSHANSRIGLNLYTIKDIENFAIIDSPGDTELDIELEYFALKGHAYSKMIIYMINEETVLDADTMTNNKKLESLIKAKLQFKIPLLILLTHSDTYCTNVKQTSEDWKKICKSNINDNKKKLFEYIKKLEEKNANNYQIEEGDIIHICLVKSIQIKEEDIINSFSNELKLIYQNSDEKTKKALLQSFDEGTKSKEKAIEDFLKSEINVLDQKELIEKIKIILPSQYHRVFVQ